jgi:hypothetical protein
MLKRSSVRLIVLGSLLVAVAAVAAVASEGSRAFRVRDDCDPATFNAAIHHHEQFRAFGRGVPVTAGGQHRPSEGDDEGTVLHLPVHAHDNHGEVSD